VGKLAEIRQANIAIRSPHTQRTVRQICDIGDKIIQDFRDDPSDIPHARNWLDVYLQQTLDIVKQYASLSRNGMKNIEAQQVLVNCDRTLVVIKTSSDELLDKLLHNDISGLDATQAVIRQLLESEKM
jgi:5-bromo-4-chloroindolyl phosphate hydrolysis protein